jgi:aspartyl-tRNA(Asn)/glutamyl-tRNA(Gln) amidotransferase subunit B
MEEGSLRVDANVSIRPVGETTFGTKTELKNMNSFRFLERGIDAEIARQERLLADGGEVEQETLHFDPSSGSLTSLRSKEEAHDYRYFPEPDLVPLAPTEEMLERARAALPELPAARAERLERDLELPADTAKLLAFRSDLGDFYEAALAADGEHPRRLANWTVNELTAGIGDADPATTQLEPAALARLVGMVADKEVSANAAREVLTVLIEKGGDPAEVVEAEGLGRAGGDELGEIVDRAIADNPDAVEKIKAGKGQAIGALVGAVMRETQGRADGGEVQRLIRERLGG